MKSQHLIAAGAAQKLVSHYPVNTNVDTHQFQRDAMAQFPTEFVRDLLSYDCNITDFSRDFSLWIKRDWTNLVAPTQKVSSSNLVDNISENQEWRIL